MSKPYIYVASSWRNEARQQMVVKALRERGADVYDFRDPEKGFHWSEIDPGWKTWDAKTFVAALLHPLARAGYRADMGALEACDLCILVTPCGRSAHLELGHAVGAKKPTGILLDGGEPELMYTMARYLTADVGRLCDWAQMEWELLGRKT